MKVTFPVISSKQFNPFLSIPDALFFYEILYNFKACFIQNFKTLLREYLSVKQSDAVFLVQKGQTEWKICGLKK